MVDSVSGKESYSATALRRPSNSKLIKKGSKKKEKPLIEVENAGPLLNSSYSRAELGAAVLITAEITNDVLVPSSLFCFLAEKIMQSPTPLVPVNQAVFI
jgi:hypothetical protein